MNGLGVGTRVAELFNTGSTVPVKVTLTGASAGITTGAANLEYQKVDSTTSGTVNEAVSTSAATTGSLFRYDPTSGQYIFNWRTTGLTAGTYQLTIDLHDGASHQVTVGLR